MMKTIVRLLANRTPVLTPVILATQEAEIRTISVKSQQVVLETLS
jgi:hypothetical protein